MEVALILKERTLMNKSKERLRQIYLSCGEDVFASVKMLKGYVSDLLFDCDNVRAIKLAVEFGVARKVVLSVESPSDIKNIKLCVLELTDNFMWKDYIAIEVVNCFVYAKFEEDSVILGKKSVCEIDFNSENYTEIEILDTKTEENSIATVVLDENFTAEERALAKILYGKSGDDLYLEIGLPIEPKNSRKYIRASLNFGISDYEKIFLIYDGTVFGECTIGFSACSTGLYLCEDVKDGPIYISWEDFINISVSKEFIGSFAFDMSNNADFMESILEEIQDEIALIYT